VLAKHLVGIEILRARQRLRFGDADAKALPRDDRRDCLERVLPSLARRNQGGADTRIKADLLVDGASVGLKGTAVPGIGLGEHRADEPFEQVDRLIGQGGAEIKGDRGQGCVSALPFVSSEMLGRRPSSLTGEPRETKLMHAMPACGVDADRPDMVQTLNGAEHRGRLCRLGHLAQPAEPALAGFRPALRQRIQPPPLLGGQAIGQPSLYLPPRSKAEINTEAFQAPRRRNDDPALAAFLHDQLAEMEEAVVLKGLRSQSISELGSRSLAEGTQAEPLLTLNGVPLPVPLRGEIRLDRRGKNVDLLCHKGNQLGRGPLTASQRATRIAQIAQHEGATEAVMLAPTPPNDREITGGQRVVADEFTAIGWRIKQHGDLGLGQLLAVHRLCSSDVSYRQASRSEPRSR
jgi:hypothetical protein